MTLLIILTSQSARLLSIVWSDQWSIVTAGLLACIETIAKQLANIVSTENSSVTTRAGDQAWYQSIIDRQLMQVKSAVVILTV